MFCFNDRHHCEELDLQLHICAGHPVRLGSILQQRKTCSGNEMVVRGIKTGITLQPNTRELGKFSLHVNKYFRQILQEDHTELSFKNSITGESISRIQ